MTIEKIKNKINDNINKKVVIKYNGSRNKTEVYSGVILESYNYVFIVKLDGEKTMSFSYVDVLTKSIEVKFLAIWVHN